MNISKMTDQQVKDYRLDIGVTAFAKLVASDLQKAIRMESADRRGYAECVTCPTRHYFKDMDAGHFIAGRTYGVLLEEDNIHPQCRACNKHKSGNQDEYQKWMIENYGEERVDELRRLRHKSRSISEFEYREELFEKRKGYKARIKLQQRRLGVK